MQLAARRRQRQRTPRTEPWHQRRAPTPRRSGGAAPRDLRGTGAGRRAPFLRRRLRRTLPRTERPPAGGAGALFPRGAHRRRIRPHGGGPRAAGRPCGHRLHPRHGIELLLLRRRAHRAQHAAAGLGSGRRRKRDVHRPATRREPAERALRRIAAPALFRGGAACTWDAIF